MNITEKVWVGRRTAIEPAKIVCLISDLNYTRVHYCDGSVMILSYTLKKVKEAIDAYGTFVRINRQSVVNWSFVGKYDRKYIQLENEACLQVSRRRCKLIEKRLYGEVI